MLFLLLVMVFSKLSKRWWFFLLLGWGKWTLHSTGAYIRHISSLVLQDLLCSSLRSHMVHFVIDTSELTMQCECKYLSSGVWGGGGGVGKLLPQTFQLPPQNIFFLIPPMHFFSEVKYMLLPKIKSAFSYELGHISPCTLCKIFALQVGPSYMFRASPPKRNFPDRINYRILISFSILRCWLAAGSGYYTIYMFIAPVALIVLVRQKLK